MDTTSTCTCMTSRMVWLAATRHFSLASVFGPASQSRSAEAESVTGFSSAQALYHTGVVVQWHTGPVEYWFGGGSGNDNGIVTQRAGPATYCFWSVLTSCPLRRPRRTPFGEPLDKRHAYRDVPSAAALRCFASPLTGSWVRH